MVKFRSSRPRVVVDGGGGVGESCGFAVGGDAADVVGLTAQVSTLTSSHNNHDTTETMRTPGPNPTNSSHIRVLSTATETPNLET